MYWDLGTDTFTFNVDLEGKPFKRQGVMSVVKSLFDPMGIAAPVVIKGNMLLRSMSAHFKDHQLGAWNDQSRKNVNRPGRNGASHSQVCNIYAYHVPMPQQHLQKPLESVCTHFATTLSRKLLP